MITVIGKLADTKEYVGRDGFNVLSQRADWTPALNQAWIDEAMQRGDALLFVSWQVGGQYREELKQVLAYLLKESVR